MKDLILKPRLSEQTYALATAQRTYIFDVPASTNKHDVARAVAEQFSVKVERVNIANIPGKAKNTVSLTGRRRGNPGQRSPIAKAYVRLVEGASLPIFAAVEAEQEKQEKAQAEIEKAVTKQTKREPAKQPANEKKSERHGLRIFNRQGNK